MTFRVAPGLLPGDLTGNTFLIAGAAGWRFTGADARDLQITRNAA
jgi:hypothetical protein